MESPFDKYDTIVEPPYPDWVLSPNSVVNDEQVLDAIEVDPSNVPRQRAVVLHDSHSRYGEIVRIEARIGEKQASGWVVPDTYREQGFNVITDESHPYFKDWGFRADDSTYVDIFYEVPPILQPVLDAFEE